MDHEEITRPDPDLVTRLGAFPTSTLANALDELSHHENVLATIKGVAPGFRFAGPALTVKELTGDPGTYTSADFAVGAMIDAAEAGDVIVVEEGGVPYSTWGGMASLAAKTKGVAGLIVDGGVRDLEEIVAFDFPVFARHLVPTTGRTRLKVEAINVPVTVDEVRVEPGDIMIADGTGIVCIPVDAAEKIAQLAEVFARNDDAAAIEIRKGTSFSQVMAKFSRI